jgi:NAD(P)-dependent dehydrogenase (short-subunit alcohol dehydrogenase family)
MDLGLQGKRALVTGSSAGIGAAIAEALAAEGVSVVVHGRDPVRTKAVAELISKRGGHAEVAVGDLTTEAVPCSGGERPCRTTKPLTTPRRSGIPLIAGLR